MPLERGKSQAAIGRNIATERNAGRSKEVAAAIAFSEARKSGYKDKRKPKGKAK